jgi:hypothetical protein
MHRTRDASPKSRSDKAHAHHSHSDQTVQGRRLTSEPADEVTCVRLTRKYANAIDGVDLRNAHVGDRLDLSPHDAEVLIAEGWAEHAARRGAKRHISEQAIAADKPRRRKPVTKKR